MSDDEIAAERDESVRRIVESNARAKVVVAGPGTGKTYTFGKVIDRTEGRPLVLSFLNNLVRDLDQDLGDRADVRTFHRFSRWLLHSRPVDGLSNEFAYFPGLTEILQSDLAVCGRPVADGELDRRLMNLDESDDVIALALQAGSYYDAVGHNDAVYRVYRAIEHQPSLAPDYPLVLVDEYQDFSLLEISLIGLLSQRSPVLVAGDDDQALYTFRHASADYLRQLVDREDYETFVLPYCSRCTQVLVNATHLVVQQAQQRGLLEGRIPKRYECYLPSKRSASELYPKIRHARCTVETGKSPYVCRYVAQQIDQISPEDIALSHREGHPTALVIGPVQFVRRVHQFLQDQGVPNLTFRRREDFELDLLEAYQLLSLNEASRLGWRILIQAWSPSGWQQWVRAAVIDNEELAQLIDPAFREEHLSVARIVAALRAEADVENSDIGRLEAAVGLPIGTIRQRLELDPVEPHEEQIDESQPTVVLTTLQGAKGLQAEHVYIVGMNGGHFPQNNDNPSEDEVCQLLVALTRARQSCTLVSCGRFGQQSPVPQSAFVGWLGDAVQVQAVNAAYWSQP